MAVAGIACTLLRAMVTTSHARRGINKTYSLPNSWRAGGGEQSQAFFGRKMQQCVIFFLFHISFFCIAIKERNMVRGTGRHKPLKKSTLIDSGLQAGITGVNICYSKALAEESQQTPILTFSQKGRNKYSKPAN